MLGALDIHFRNAGYKFMIIKDEEFAECRQVLNGKAMNLERWEKGSRGTRQM